METNPVLLYLVAICILVIAMVYFRARPGALRAAPSAKVVAVTEDDEEVVHATIAAIQARNVPTVGGSAKADLAALWARTTDQPLLGGGGEEQLTATLEDMKGKYIAGLKMEERQKLALDRAVGLVDALLATARLSHGTYMVVKPLARRSPRMRKQWTPRKQGAGRKNN